MLHKSLTLITFSVFFSILSLTPQYASATTAADGSPCTTAGQVVTVSDGNGGTTTLVCNQGVLYQGVMMHWYESCSFGLTPGCPGVATPVVPGSVVTVVAQAPATPNPVTGYCRPGKDAIVDMPWPGFGYRSQVRPLTNGFNNSTISFRIVVPPLSSTIPAAKYQLPKDALVSSGETFLRGEKSGFIHIAETPGSQTTMHITNISKIPCDLYHSAITAAGEGGTAPSLNFGLWDRPGYGTQASNFPLMFHPGEVLYVNVTHDTTGYGTIPIQPSYQSITNMRTCDGGGCDILFDFAIPQAGTYAPDVQPNGSQWPEDSKAPGWPIFSEAYNRAHPVGTCSIRYGVDNAGHATIGAIDQGQHTTTGDNILSSKCYLDSLLAEIARQKAAVGFTGGNTLGGTPIGTVPIASGGTTSTGLSFTFGGQTIRLTNEAAIGIIQSLAQNAGVSSGLTIQQGNAGTSATIGGQTFTGTSNADLAAKYLAYLVSQQTVSSGAINTIINNASNALSALTSNLAPGDYNPADQVTTLQTFLNRELQINLPITGFFGDQTLTSVKTLQTKYASQTYLKAGLSAPTGFVGPYTRELINSKLGLTANTTGTTPTVSTSQNFCTGSDQIISVPWPASGQVRPTTSGFLDQTLAFKITVPSTFTPPLNINHLGFIHIAEVEGPVAGEEVTISKNACDFQTGNYITSSLGASAGIEPGFNFTVNNPNSVQAHQANLNINAGDTLYVNVRNQISGHPTCRTPITNLGSIENGQACVGSEAPGTSVCASGYCSPKTSKCVPYICDVLFDFATPNRY
ncbi:MAG: hypothetical protein JWN18_174 [Parcubacteria group bacterium]|nr:hypothetical protein [Parcubacteria group bacterium]